MERHGITLDEAFARMRELSQHHNVRLVEVAATVVGIAVPETARDWEDLAQAPVRSQLRTSARTSPAWDALRQQPHVQAGTLSALLDSLTGAAHEGNDAAELLVELLAVHGVEALVIFRVSFDGSLRLVGYAGYPGDSVSAWRSIPPGMDVPFIRSLATGQALFLSDREERAKAFPSIAGVSAGFEASASIPVRSGGDVLGIVGLSWRDSQAFDPERRDRITQSVERVTARMLRHVVDTDPEFDWATTILAANMDPWLLLEAIPSADGVVRDFVVQATSDRLPEGGLWLGRRLLELWPALAEDDTVGTMAVLARTGGLWTGVTTSAAGTPWGRSGLTIRAVRVGNRVVVVWRP